MTAFLRIWRRLPSPDAILLAPDRAEVPSDPATLYALCGALARKASDINFGQIVAYVKRLPAEFGVLLVKDAVTRTPAVQATAGFVEWASRNSAVLV